jgi:hypothetical protein
MKAIKSALLGLALAGLATAATAQNEQFIPMIGYWVGLTPPAGSGSSAGSSITSTCSTLAMVV